MISSDSTIFELLSSLFESRSDERDSEKSQSANPFLDLFSAAKYAVQTLAIMLIRKLLDQSLLQSYIISTIQHFYQAMIAAHSIIPPPIQIVLLFILFFVYMPQIARALSPIISRFRSYKNYFFPPKESPVYTKRNKPPSHRKFAQSSRAHRKEKHPLSGPTGNQRQLNEFENLEDKVHRIVIESLRRLSQSPRHDGSKAFFSEGGTHQPTSKEETELRCISEIQHVLSDTIVPQRDEISIDLIVQSVVAQLREEQKQNTPQRESRVINFAETSVKPSSTPPKTAKESQGF